MALSLCSSSVANTGELACDKSRGVLKKIFIFNSSIGSSDYADAATLFAKLVTNSKLSKSDGNKVFVINEAQDIADASDSNKEGSLGLGFKTVLIEGKPGYKVKIFAGGDLLKRLRTFNNQTVRILEYDANNVLWGTKSGSSFQGFQAKLFFTGNKIATGQNVEEGIVEFSASIISTSEYFDNAYWANLAGNNVEDIKPLLDAQLAYVSKASNVYKYSVKVPDSNLVDDYDVLADYGTPIAATTFTAKSGASAAAAATGSSLAIDSVAYDSTNSLLTVTYNNTAYGTAGAYIKLIPPTPAVLDAADVTNLEILSTTHAK
jgi:hypothetical protein